MISITNDSKLSMSWSTYNNYSKFLGNPDVTRVAFNMLLKYKNKATLSKVVDKLKSLNLEVKIPDDYNLNDSDDIKETYESKITMIDVDWVEKPLDVNQEKGVIMMSSMMKFINMDDTGAGKTYQSITSLNPKFREGLLDFLLVLTPMKVVNKWKREILQFGSFAEDDEIRSVFTGDVESLYDLVGYKVVIMSYDTYNTLVKKELKKLKRGKTVRSKPIYDFSKFGKKLGVILDEAHKIKNPKTQTAQYLLVHKDSFDSVYALSATLAPNKFYELWSTLYFIDEGLAGLSYKDFINEFYSLDQWGNPKIPKEESIEDFIENKMKPFMIKRDLKDLGVTLKREINYIDVEMGNKHKTYYKGVINETLGEMSRSKNVYDLKTASGMFPLAQQLCVDPSIVANSTAYRKYGNEYVKDWDFVTDNRKFDELITLLHKHNDSVVLLWTYRPSMSTILYDALIDTGYLKPDEVINSFEFKDSDSLGNSITNNIKVVIMALGRFSTGIDLLFSNVSIFWDRSFSYVEWYQAIGRSYRINSTKNVFIYVLQFKDSIEMTIELYMKQKKNLDNSLKRDLTREELKSILFGGSEDEIW